MFKVRVNAVALTIYKRKFHDDGGRTCQHWHVWRHEFPYQQDYHQGRGEGLEWSEADGQVDKYEYY